MKMDEKTRQGLKLIIRRAIQGDEQAIIVWERIQQRIGIGRS